MISRLSSSRLMQVWRDPVSAVGVATLLILALLAVAAPLIAHHDPTQIDTLNRLKPPSTEHWLGTDRAGRDIFARALFGARVSLSIGALVGIATFAAGITLGMLAGYVRWLDGIIMRTMDGIMAIPAVLLGVASLMTLGTGMPALVVAIGLPLLPDITRMTRSLTLSIRTEAFVEAAIMTGTRTPMLLLRHILPNAVSPLIVLGTYIAAVAIIAEAVLSFLGIGTPPEMPSWGNMIAEGRTSFQVAPWVVFVPSCFLAITVLSINMVGDRLREIFDPVQGDAR